MDGVYETVVGYTGGTSPYPTYRNIGDHMESLQIRFDPARISYEDLLRKFWGEHDYNSQPWSRQYMNAVFYHTDEQKEKILKSMDRLSGNVVTQVLRYVEFFPAEDYHQKFYLQRYSSLRDEFQVIYPDFKDLVRSTAAARVNGILGGYTDSKMLDGSLEELGLSKNSLEFLQKRMSR